MRAMEARELFRQLAASYFTGADVIIGRQSRIAKPNLPLVTITTGGVTRAQYPVTKSIDGYSVSFYPSRMQMSVDLFTHGKPLVDHGKVVAYEDSAMDDMLSFADFLGSPHTVQWCHRHDAAIAIDGQVQDLTGVVNDSTYEYRAKLDVIFSFTQTAVGHAGVLSEGSLLYPHDTEEWTEQKREETGDPEYSPAEDPEVVPDPEDPGTVYTPEPPQDSESMTGERKPPDSDADRYFSAALVRPKYGETSSGGGSEDLAEEDRFIGWFNEAEIKERKEEESA